MDALVRRTVVVVAAAALLASCSSSPRPRVVAPVVSPSHSNATSKPSGHIVKPQKPVPAESNPPGDIPDNTAFIPYRSQSGHFAVRIPEGWSRRTTKSSFSFTDKLNSVSATWFRVTHPPTKKSASSTEVPELRRTQRAFRLSHVIACAPGCTIPYSTAPISVTLPAAHAIVITYGSNSAPNRVTGKQYRDEELRFEFFKNGEEVALTLSGPVGSDNVDPWTLVSQSFRWLR